MKVQFGSIVTDGRKSLGGHTYSRNHYGNYSKNKPIPPVFSSTAARANKAFFKDLSPRWKNNLNQSQRDNWATLAQSVTWYDVFGNPYHPTPYNLFMSCNINSYPFTSAFLDDAPIHELPPDMSTATLTVVSSGTQVFINLVPLQTVLQNFVRIDSTFALSGGINYVQAQFSFFQRENFYSGTVFDFSSAWTSQYGGISVGQKIFMRITPVNINTGFVGTTLIAVGIAT